MANSSVLLQHKYLNSIRAIGGGGRYEWAEILKNQMVSNLLKFPVASIQINSQKRYIRMKMKFMQVHSKMKKYLKKTCEKLRRANTINYLLSLSYQTFFSARQFLPLCGINRNSYIKLI